MNHSVSMLRIALVVVPLVVICAFASAEEQKAKPKTCVTSPDDVAGLNEAASTNVNAIRDFKITAHHMLEQEKFGQLDCLANSLRTSKERFPGGLWKLHSLYIGLSTPPLHPTAQDWAKHMALVNAWVARNPRSITARIVLAESYNNYGADARGTGFADTVSASGWKMLAESSHKAKNVLDQATKLPKKCPEWYYAMQLVVPDLDWEPARRRALLDEAIKFEPGYFYNYRIFARYTQTQWGGEPGETKKFLQEEADKIGGEDGDIVYFQVANELICGCGSDSDLNLSWPRIKSGFAATEKKYGTSMENLNLMASMARAFNDAVLANKLFQRIGEQWSEAKWGSSAYYDGARQWAKAMAPIQEKQQAVEESAAAAEATPEGMRYKAVVVEKFHEWAQACLDEMGSDSYKSEWIVQISPEGRVEHMFHQGSSVIMNCLGQKLADIHTKNEAPFPPAPKPDYWVRFDFDPADFSRTAAK